MRKDMKRIMAKTLALALALTTVAAAVPSGEAQAAKKLKLNKKSVTVKVKKSATVKVKNVKAKKVKKLTVKSSKKKIATVKKKGKAAFTITGKKAGKATVTAKVKVGKKTTTLKVAVTVKKAGNSSDNTTKPSSTPAGASPSAAASQAPAGSASPAAPSSVPASQVPATTTPGVEPTPTPTPKTFPYTVFDYTFDEENETEAIGDWYARYNEDDSTEAGVETKLSISKETESGTGGAMLMSGRLKGWNSPGIDLTNVAVPGAKYKVSFSAKVPSEDEDFEDINIRVSGATKMEEDAEEGYENYPADTDYVTYIDKWTHFDVEFTVPSAFSSYIFYFETNGTGKASFLLDNIKLECVSEPNAFDPNLPSIRDTYKTVGIENLGTAVSYDQLLNPNILGFVKHHYNSITLGNAWKPDAVMGTSGAIAVPKTPSDDAEYVEAAAKIAGYQVPDTYADHEANLDENGNIMYPTIDFTTIDKCMKLAKENGLRIRYHTLVWHAQMPKYFFTEQYKDGDDAKVVTDQATILDREEMYIRTVMNHILTSEYADVIYTVDVVNEYTHMKNESIQVGSDNWWKYSFGTEMKTDCEYVKKAFVWAYDELVKAGRTDISLMYNDYDTYNPNTTDQIIELINNINTKDDVNKVGKICAGVGMQSHLNNDLGTEAFKTAIEKFNAAGFEIQITELDIASKGPVTNDTPQNERDEVYAANAEMYAGIMKTIIDQKKAGVNISSVTIWGISDATSWMDDRAPVLFGKDVSDKKPSFDAVINAVLNYGK